MDGMASAWVCFQKYNNDAEYIACDDWINLPINISSLSGAELSEKEIYIVDFSFTKEILLDLESKCKKLVILDHHVGAKENIESVHNHVYGVGISGCALAWNYFYPELEMPLAIQYISDSDTWTNKMPDYKYVNAYIYKGDKDLSIQMIDEIVKELEDTNNFERIKKIGQALHDSREGNIKRYIERAELIDFEGHQVYAVNAPSEIKSELGHELAKKTNSFSIIYQYVDNKWKISLRSVADFDVSVIAIKHGGGGHKNAAAFTIKADNPILQVIKNI